MKRALKTIGYTLLAQIIIISGFIAHDVLVLQPERTKAHYREIAKKKEKHNEIITIIEEKYGVEIDANFVEDILYLERVKQLDKNIKFYSLLNENPEIFALVKEKSLGSL